MKRVLPAVALLLSIASGADADVESWFDDLTFDASSMAIDGVELGDVEQDVRFDRDNLVVTGGKGRATLGLIYQTTSKDAGIRPGVEDSGLMLGVGYDHLLSMSWRLDLMGRVGLTGTDEYQPLYAEDTDVRANLVWFDSDGAGHVGGEPIFPSGYVGTIVNRFGRVQMLGGVGGWWRGIGTYVTAFRALNGEDPIFLDGSYGRVNFANLENAGYSVSLSYSWRTLGVRLKRNFPIKNGSDDFTVGVVFRHYPQRRSAT